MNSSEMPRLCEFSFFTDSQNHLLFVIGDFSFVRFVAKESMRCAFTEPTYAMLPLSNTPTKSTNEKCPTTNDKCFFLTPPPACVPACVAPTTRSEEHTSELQSHG